MEIRYIPRQNYQNSQGKIDLKKSISCYHISVNVILKWNCQFTKQNWQQAQLFSSDHISVSWIYLVNSRSILKRRCALQQMVWWERKVLTTCRQNGCLVQYNGQTLVDYSLWTTWQPNIANYTYLKGKYTFFCWQFPHSWLMLFVTLSCLFLILLPFLITVS